MIRLVQLSMVVGVLSGLTLAAQTRGPQGDHGMSKPTNSDVSSKQAPEDSSPAAYREMDLLRRSGFAEASKGTISVRIIDGDGLTPAGLHDSDFILTVNGTKRAARLHSPGSAASVASPVVLLVFPPNDPVVHHIAVGQVRMYFSAWPAQLLPWKVGIFDSNRQLTPFTDERTQLLADLDVIDHTSEPFEYANESVLPKGARWDGGWGSKAQEAIGAMQPYDGAKVILAMNPSSESIYGTNSGYLAHDGPDSLVPAARHIGAHIYIANVGGPDAVLPSRDVSQDEYSRINMADTNPVTNGSAPGSLPDSLRMDPEFAALRSFTYRTSQMMQVAASTLGGFSNSFKDLAAQIHRDLDHNYSLDFDMTPEDQDRGLPSVEVKLVRSDLRIKMLDLVPKGRTPAVDDGEMTPQQLQKLLHQVDLKPVLSPDFRISQRVDYFPLHGGLAPVLPMSASIDWTGREQAPMLLSFVESIDDLTHSTTMVSRNIRARWDGHKLSWERDDQLRPGHYVWRIIIHDASGNILASGRETIAVDSPGEVSLRESSLILGTSCRNPGEATGGLKKRPPPGSKRREQDNLLIDPLRVADCRIKPEAGSVFTSTDQLHALVRIYPDEKYGRQRPESWTAKFFLRSNDGAIEGEKEVQFLVDSGSGYLASIEMPLDSPGIERGLHTVDVETRGPGIRGYLKQSRAVSIR